MYLSELFLHFTCFTLAVQSGRAEEKPLTLPQFVPFSVESSPGSKLDAQLKVCLVHLWLEKEERD